VPSNSGNSDSFEAFFLKWRPILFSLAQEILSDADQAEDVAQCILTRLWAAGAWTQIAWPGAYIRQAARREALKMRQKRRRWASLGHVELLAFPSGALDPAEAVEKQEFLECLEDRLGALPPRCGLVMALTHLQGLTRSEAAERLEISEKAVERQVRRGRDHLRKWLEREDDGSVSWQSRNSKKGGEAPVTALPWRTSGVTRGVVRTDGPTPGGVMNTCRDGSPRWGEAALVPAGNQAARWGAVLATLLFLFLGLPGPSVVAQTVQGQVLERNSGGPVEGALVLLLDEASATQGGYLTNPMGRFLIRAPGPGRYEVRAERIGYETATSASFVLAPGETVNLRLEVAEAPILLEELRVEGQQRCVVRPGDGMELARVWEEARKALTVQDWTARQGAYHFQLARWERELDPQGRLVLREDRRVERYLSRNPIRTHPVEDLLERGFVQPDDEGGYVYYGPDAAVLLSDLFLDNYCFRLTEEPSEPHLVGLSFEPVRGRGPPAIQGTLWLERETARLQFLEYDYAWSPWAEARGVAEGRVYFQELPGGAWIVRRWWIRMPSMEAAPGLRPGSALRVVGIREEGAEVRRITSLGQPALPEAPTGILAGSVHDSIGSVPLAGATVFLISTGELAVTDPGGQFVMDSVPAGRHQVAFNHPLLDSLGVVPSEVEVSVTGGRTTSVDLFVPSREGLLEAHCGEMEEGASAVVGRVRSDVAGDPVSGATVALEWSRYRSPTGAIQELQTDIHGLETVTDAGGRFRVCGVPTGWPVTAQASFGSYRSPSRELRLTLGEVRVVDLTLNLPGAVPEGPVAPGEPAAPGEATGSECATPEASSGLGVVEGEVREGATGVVLGMAAVRLMPADSGEARGARADGSGRFAFCDVPAGSWGVEGWLGEYRGGPERLSVMPGERAYLALDLRFASGEARTGGLRGRVVDAASGEPVGTAEVELVGTRQRALTREDGGFTFSSLEPGEVRLRVTHLGYGEAEGVVQVAAGEMVEVEVKLATEVIALDPITVTATRRNLPLWEMQGLQQRIESGWGQFVLREEIEVRSPYRVVDLLVGTGVDVYADGQFIRMRRTGCEPLVYLDGQKVSALGAAEALRLVHPADLFAIEIYRGPAETPSQYIDTNSRCGVILLWTHRGR